MSQSEQLHHPATPTSNPRSLALAPGSVSLEGVVRHVKAGLAVPP